MYGADDPHTVEYQIYRGEATHNSAPERPGSPLDRGRSSDLLVFDCNFTDCFTAHMHEIPK